MSKSVKVVLAFILVVLVLGSGSYFLAKEYPELVDFSFPEDQDQRSGN